MMTPTLLLPLLGLLSSWEGGHCLVPEKLEQMSVTGSRYIDREVENAINGVRQMKTLMEKADKDHRDILNALEDTKKKKEEALLRAKETEQQLTEKTEVCNETMLALWEECKPCLKQTCMRFYTRTCHSGAGLVGRQLEEFLNRSSPFSIWVNGERIDSLMDVDEQQGQRLDDLEERYAVVEEGVDDLFQKSTQVYGRFSPFFQSPFGGFRDAFWAPVRSIQRPFPGSRIARNVPAFSFFPSNFQHHQEFHQLFQPLFEMTQRLFEGAQRAMEQDGQWLEGTRRPFLVAPYPSDDRMVCREIRRNSAGCLRLREKCEKCQAILDVDCSQTDPDQTLLRDHFKDHLLIAERLTRQYDDLLRSFQEEMFNTTSLLDQLNKQFGWVSQVANHTLNGNQSLRVIMVQTNSSTTDLSEAPVTQVNVQLFDLDPLSLTVQGNIDDPGFMESVVNQILRQYKENKVE
ncbi:clusterin-like [Tiliqua scincoides]|uniref:clusterin-like n=1 Tax=Tiliqua scincoides TaxID=71010 RepID=UPI0034631587